jgi:flagellar basal-body rod protein FlgB
MNEISDALMAGTGTAQSVRGGGSLHEHALRLRGLRMQLIAANIANAETPNYKARDIDFSAELKRAMASTVNSNAASESQNRHNVPEPKLLYRVPLQPSLDGNSVEMDAERAAFAREALMYEFTLQRVSGMYKEMSELFKTLVG